ncbi:MAG: hypothetical protein ACLPXW_09425, partial [Xanthobacteraceae bacterium]
TGFRGACKGGRSCYGLREGRYQCRKNPSSPAKNKRHRYIRAVYGPIDRRFPERNPEIEALYPGHFLPSSPQMLEELLRRNLELEQSVIRKHLILVRAA